MVSCSAILKRIWLLVWKNYLLQRRHYVVTGFEIFLPLFFILILFIRNHTGAQDSEKRAADRAERRENERNRQIEANRKEMRPDNYGMYPDDYEVVKSYGRGSPKYVHEAPMNSTVLYIETAMHLCTATVAYAPRHPRIQLIVKKIFEFLQMVAPCEGQSKGIRTVGYDDETAILKSIKMETRDGGYHNHITAAIIFNDGIIDNGRKSKSPNISISYTIRMGIVRKGGSYNRGQVKKTDTNKFYDRDADQYSSPYSRKAYYSFCGLQMLIDRFIIQRWLKTEFPRIDFQVLPHQTFLRTPSYKKEIYTFLPVLLVLGFIFIIPAIIPAAVSEKKSGIKELMKMMGLPNWIHWFAWMIPSIVILTITNIFIVLLLFVSTGHGAVLPEGDPSLCFFALFLWSFSAISFCFFLSVIFQKPSLATAVGVILWMVLTLAVNIPLQLYYDRVSFSGKMLVALLPQASLFLAMTAMQWFENEGSGATWDNFAEPLNAVDGLSIAYMYLMFIVDAIIYMLLAIYLESVLPSEFGLKKPCYYIFLPSTWTGHKKVAQMKEEVVELGRPGFEAETKGLVPGIVIKGLTKRFGRNNAVDGVSLKMYDGEITALLGHNGAGKTTTMSMLTGLFAPTSGTAIVNGYDIRTSMDQVRSSLGLCPQHNMLFDDLTVAEHLIFFGMVKGLSKDAATLEMKTMLGRLHMIDKIFALSSTLSGGQKRKLSLGIALVGGTKVVVLDEPTSGMDPEARRAVWDLLLDMRGDRTHRTILLTTHYMEEADILGDKIAIMAAGKVKCYGTPLFLKHFFGAGYTLKITTTNSNSNAEAVFQAVQKHIPDAYYKAQRSSNSAEISK